MAEPVIMLTGTNGQLGFELWRSLQPLGRVVATTREARPDTVALDLADLGAIDRLVDEVRPTVIVNAAAYTGVDAAEDDADGAWLVNADVPDRLAGAAARHGAAMVHFSTDYVFDGTERTPYTEADAPAPLNGYGRSKLAGERAVAAAGCASLVFRTSWLYGARGRNFLRTMLALGNGQREVRVVSDQVGSPTSARCVAAATAQILAQLRATGRGWFEPRCGLYHLSAAGQCAWHEFAGAIFAETRPRHGAPTRVVPISSAQFGARAPRPAYSVLSNERLWRAFGLRLPDWETQLRLVLGECAVTVPDP